MVVYLLKKLREIFFPERSHDDGVRSVDPIDILTAVHRQLVQLAEQIQSHAECAPYPQVTERLRQIASEKQNSAQEIRRFMESRRWRPGKVSTLPVSGKNHWERMMRDLSDQRTLDQFLAVHEPRLSAESPELAELLRQLKSSQAVHRGMLARLVAVADPQATQT